MEHLERINEIKEYSEALVFCIISNLEKGNKYDLEDEIGHAFLVSRILSSNIPPKMNVSKESMLKGVEIYFDAISLMCRELESMT
ncbi:MAG: hypothetical protein WAT79_08200, partial [Saprospiraceae bacterium]